jgi:hypothetical protein
MGLKGDREVLQTNIRYKIEAGKDAERGIILVASATDGTAAVPDTGNTVVGSEGLGQETITSNRCRPVGLLLDDVENLDFTTRPQIWVRQVVARGGEVGVLTKGRVKVNLIDDGVEPAQGEIAYLAPSGYLSNVPHVSEVAQDGPSGIVVGYWESSKDADGYAHLYVDINGGPRIAQAP